MKKNIGALTLEALTHLLSGNVQNGTVFRESGGAKQVLALISLPETRQCALGTQL